jgi:thiol:disulfide interchange protein DsbG
VTALLGSAALLGLLAVPAQAQETSWKQNFAACAGNSPFIEALLAEHSDDHRPLMKIGEMQAWAIKGEDGTPTVALTTEDGLTIIGKILGPQGEDISGALLATVPNEEAGTLPTAAPSMSVPATRDLQAKTSETDAVARETAAVVAPVESASPADQESSVSPALARLRDAATQTATPEASTGPLATTAEQTAQLATAPITASAPPSPEVQAGMNAILSQATDERVWFSAAEAKPGAPVVYMLADPECPHCQWTIDKMHAQIASGDIDLRIIFAPVTGVGGFNTSLSILHADDIPASFMAHMTSTTRGTQAVTQMDVNQADRNVVQGIVDNINWMRGNRMPGVPFFLYMTEDGARFAFSELPADILTTAKPL